MSQKPALPPQECDPSTLGVARKPRPVGKRKPQTEVVVQLGPYTEGQITAPELVRPLEGPTDWLIKPKTGEIVPFDPASPPEKDVIRKYINVGAQDTDVPDQLPKTNEGFVVERVNTALLPGSEGDPSTPLTNTVRIIDKEGPASLECEAPPPPKPPGNTNEQEDCNTTVCPPVPKGCNKVVDAVDDCASTLLNCPVTVDVLANDLVGGQSTISKATAEHGTVDISNGQLVYTPNDGFTGQDVISYTVGEEGCPTDTAQVFITVKPAVEQVCAEAVEEDCSIKNTCPLDIKTDTLLTRVDDHQYSSDTFNSEETLFEERSADTHVQSGPGSWSTSFNACRLDSGCPAIEETAVAC